MVSNDSHIKLFSTIHFLQYSFDPLGRPAIPAGKYDHYFFKCCPSVRSSPLFKSSKTKQQKIMVATGETVVGLAEWIIDYTYISCNFLSFVRFFSIGGSIFKLHVLSTQLLSMIHSDITTVPSISALNRSASWIKIFTFFQFWSIKRLKKKLKSCFHIFKIFSSVKSWTNH